MLRSGTNSTDSLRQYRPCRRRLAEGKVDGTPRTSTGQILRTKPYMSLDQLAGDPSSIDARDVGWASVGESDPQLAGVAEALVRLQGGM